jgi:RNA polymerase sigma factor (sigma-70 family)
MLDFQTTDLLYHLRHSSVPASYLFATIRNKTVDLIRSRTRDGSLSAEMVLQELQVSADLPQEKEVRALQKELRRLSKDDRQLLRMRFWKNLSIAEIARRRGEPYSRVAVRLFRLGKRLAMRLAEAGDPRGA